MAQIIEMESFSRFRQFREAFAGDAEILFFLGVRYERMQDTVPAPEPAQPEGTAARRGRKRRA